MQGIRDDKWREWRLDELGEPLNTDRLNANQRRHGLMPRLSGNPTDVLTGGGAWTALDLVSSIVFYNGDAVSFGGGATLYA